MMDDLPILIIGTGVAGLTLAQGLRVRSIPFRVFERHSQTYKLQGHRFRISRDSLTELETVLSPQNKDIFHQTGPKQPREAPRYVDAKELSFPPRAIVEDINAISKPIDRAWFLALMKIGIEDAVEYDKALSSYEIDAATGAVHVHFLDGSSARGRFLVGADGIRSRVRTQLQPDRKLLDLERWIMWGRTPFKNELRQLLPEDIFTWFMARDNDNNAQFIVEPMVWCNELKNPSTGPMPYYEDYIYWVLSGMRKPSQELPKSKEEKKNLLQETTKTWHPNIHTILESSPHEQIACVSVLSSKPNIEMRSSRQRGQVTIIGDAAHPMSPMGGSGASTAILSAVDLAKTIGANGVMENAIKDFESRMEERARERILHSFKGGQTYWQGKEWIEYEETELQL